MRGAAPVLAGIALLAVSWAVPGNGPAPASTKVRAVVVGIVQDGGLPHLGCTKQCCERARRDPSLAQRVASLALVHDAPGAARRVFMIDATPDFRSQVDSALGEAARLSRPAGSPIDGILLTHAHIGHYTGLMYLGRESMAAKSVPVWATRRMGDFLSANGPWRRLVAGQHIQLRSLEPGVAVTLAPDLVAEPLKVAHREEESDAVGYIVSGPSRRLLYIPDIDDWGRWDRDIAALVRTVDVALLDGTFYGPESLGTRSIAEVPHPYMTATMDRLEPLVREGKRVIFIHLNHSNPALAADSGERRLIEQRGFEVATDGLELEL